jgi:hypothetical protein
MGNCLTFLGAENEGLWPPSRIMIGVHFSSHQPGIDEVNFWQPYMELGTSLISPYTIYIWKGALVFCEYESCPNRQTDDRPTKKGR